MISRRELRTLEPVLDCLLSTGSSTKCAELIKYLEDKFLDTFSKAIHSLINLHSSIKIDDLAGAKKVLLPYQDKLLKFSKPHTAVKKKRNLLSRFIAGDEGFASLLASIAQTLLESIRSTSKKKVK